VGESFVILSVQTGLYCEPVAVPATFPLSEPRAPRSAAASSGAGRGLLQLPVPASCFTLGLQCSQPQSTAVFTYNGSGMSYQGVSMVRTRAPRRHLTRCLHVLVHALVWGGEHWLPLRPPPRAVALRGSAARSAGNARPLAAEA
jgi:hypothetical protein